MTKHNTQYYRVQDIYHNAQIGDTPDCVYITIKQDDVWDLFDRLTAHLRYDNNKDFELTFPCRLEQCGLWGSDLAKD